MRLHVLSDLHLEFAPFVPPPVAADVLILAGDTHPGHRGLEWVLKTFPNRPVIYLLGNHEFYRESFATLTRELKAMAAGTAVHVLENDLVTLGDTTFLGATLWTDFCLSGDPIVPQVVAQLGVSDYHVVRHPGRRGLLHPEDTRQSHLETVRWLRAQCRACRGRKLVIVTHHAPSSRSLGPRYVEDLLHPAYASNLEWLLEESGAALWVHGHIHHGNDYTVGGTRVLSNPRGYPGEPPHGFDPGMVVEV